MDVFALYPNCRLSEVRKWPHRLCITNSNVFSIIEEPAIALYDERSAGSLEDDLMSGRNAHANKLKGTVPWYSQDLKATESSSYRISGAFF